MSAILIKQRWEAWENACIQTGFTQKIQHKIMAVALGRTVTAVSKKITSLGLRAPSPIRGRMRGEKQILLQVGKKPTDQAKMIEILKTHAPLHCFQEGCLALKQGCWTQSQQPLHTNQSKGACFDRLDLRNFPFSFVEPLDFIHSEEPFSKEMGSKKIHRSPAYVSLYHVEQWASAEGFHRIKGALQHRGLSYWKDGTYFSRTQLLMHVNRLRFEHNLQPLALIEEEK